MDSESLVFVGLGLALLGVFALGFVRFVLADRDDRQFDQAQRYIDARYGTGRDNPFDRS